MFLEIASVSTVLSVELLFSCSLYISMAIMSTVTVYLLMIAPYNHIYDNIRLIVHRFLLLALCGILVAFNNLKT